MLRNILNIFLVILTGIAWVGVIGAISLDEHVFAAYGVISACIALGICYIKDRFGYDQDEEGEDL